MSEAENYSQLFKAAESLVVHAYLLALSTNEEKDWAWAREIRKPYEKMRLELGLGLDRDMEVLDRGGRRFIELREFNEAVKRGEK